MPNDKDVNFVSVLLLNFHKVAIKMWLKLLLLIISVIAMGCWSGRALSGKRKTIQYYKLKYFIGILNKL